jgi:hypothetical protein
MLLSLPTEKHVLHASVIPKYVLVISKRQQTKYKYVNKTPGTSLSRHFTATIYFRVNKAKRIAVTDI